MSPVSPRSRTLTRLPALFALAALSGLFGTGCDLEVRAHADIPLDSSHTLHATYRSGGPSNARPYRP
jgi:hypothetical protein